MATHKFQLGQVPAQIAISDAVPLGILVTDVDGRCVYCNAAFQRLCGYPLKQILNVHWTTLVHPSDRKEAECRWMRVLRTDGLSGQSISCESRLLKANGGTLWSRRHMTLLECNGSLRCVHTIEDISTFREIEQARREAEETAERMAYLAQHDSLTDLPNRATMTERFDQALTLARRNGKLVGLLFIDLDNFKQINDSFGHAHADELLVALSRRLVESVRSADVVCRYGGDEFVVLLSELERPEDAQQVAKKLCESVMGQRLVDNQEVPLSFCIGISIYPHDGDDVTTLLRMADVDMYRAKAARKALKSPAVA